MLRRGFVMKVHADRHEEYERRHNPIWEELAQALRRHGVHNYSIFLHRETNQLFGYVELEKVEQWEAIAQTDVCRRWWDWMADVMETNEDNSPVATSLEEVFHLE